MKTRAQIYEREAAALLRDISMYQILTEKQLLRLHPGKDDKIRNLLTYLVKQGRIWWEEPYYCAAPDNMGNVDWTLFAAVWVLADFIGQVEYHSIGDFPAKIIFFADSEVYEIVYIAQGREVLVTQALKNSGEPPSRYLVIVDSAEQIEALQIPNVNGYCTVSLEGDVEYYRKE